MDKRQIFTDNSELLAILTSLLNENASAAFLIDQNGLTRVNGRLERIDDRSFPYSIIIISASLQYRVLLDEIVAVNGIFRSDYSEC